MVGFRQTFNLSNDQAGNGSELLCDDDVGSSAILVSLMNKQPNYEISLCSDLKANLFLPPSRGSLSLFYQLDV